MKTPTINQLWARERNFSKFKLTGIKQELRRLQFINSTTLAESIWLEEAEVRIERMLLGWKERNEISKAIYISEFRIKF